MAEGGCVFRMGGEATRVNKCFIFILFFSKLQMVKEKWSSSSENGERRTGLDAVVPLLQVLTPVRLERSVVLHGLVSEEEMPVSPLAGGG